MKRFLIWLGLLGVLQFAGFALVHAAIFTTSFPITGTAVNSTNVIAAGNGEAWWFDRTNGNHGWLGGIPSAIDAGQYDDTSTMYLNNSGVLSIVRNRDGATLGGYSGLSSGVDIFGVSGAVKIGGTNYAVIAGTVHGVRALNLATGELTPLPGNFDFSDASGLDAILRPGGNSLNHLAIGIERGTTVPVLDIYNFRGEVLAKLNPDSTQGLVNDLSFDVANSRIYFGTDNDGEGVIFDREFDYSILALPEPAVSVTISNGQAVVAWVGSALETSMNLTSWQTITNATRPFVVEATKPALQFFRAIK